MKNIKRIITLAISIAILFVLAMPVFAAVGGVHIEIIPVFVSDGKIFFHNLLLMVQRVGHPPGISRLPDNKSRCKALRHTSNTAFPPPA